MVLIFFLFDVVSKLYECVFEVVFACEYVCVCVYVWRVLCVYVWWVCVEAGIYGE